MRAQRALRSIIGCAFAFVCCCWLPLLWLMSHDSGPDYARHILDIREGMSLPQVLRIAGEPLERKSSYDGNPLWVYEGYDVHFQHSKVDYVDPW